jgi:hypothetical protein
MSNPEQEIQQVKQRIAEVYAHREQLKAELQSGVLAPRAGLARLEETDQELSALDSRFKQLWDARKATLGDLPHPAAAWARRTTFEPLHLDCVSAIMLKILDAKCKMGEAEKTALAAVYDVIKDRSGQNLGEPVHTLIAAARLVASSHLPDAELAERIHAWRVRAEALIPKPVMKDFKQLLRASLPMH